LGNLARSSSRGPELHRRPWLLMHQSMCRCGQEGWIFDGEPLTSGLLECGSKVVVSVLRTHHPHLCLKQGHFQMWCLMVELADCAYWYCGVLEASPCFRPGLLVTARLSRASWGPVVGASKLISLRISWMVCCIGKLHADVTREVRNGTSCGSGYSMFLGILGCLCLMTDMIRIR
jgi:hypothetical protein